MPEQMQPGPELDAAVAAALGWRYVPSDEPGGPGLLFQDDGSCDWWKPSQTWNGAGLVVERLIELGWLPDILYIPDEQMWYCSFENHLPCEGHADYFMANREAPTAPHAISLAALAALEEEGT